MSFISILFFLSAAISFTTLASPMQKRQTDTGCEDISSCVIHSGTSIWFETKTGDTCPPITPPAEVALSTITQRSNPASCYYPASLDFCAMGQDELMTAMSSIATKIFNAQPSGAIICGATKTANMPVLTPAPPGMSPAIKFIFLTK
jgi:hypothetical protein